MGRAGRLQRGHTVVSQAMRLSDVLEMYGDMTVPANVLTLLGIEIPQSVDVMIGYREVNQLVRADAYRVIGQIKSRYGLEYSDNLIPLSLLCDHYHMDINGAYELIKGKEE